MDSKLIKTFVTVANHGSFTEAAKELYIAQSAVSKHITQLEKELGVQLFQRDSRIVRLTPMGEVFYRDAVEILRRMDAAVDALQNAAESGAGSLTAGAFSVLAGEVVSLVRRFHNTYLNVELTLDWYEFGDLIRKVEEGELDVGFSIAFASEGKPQLRKKSIEKACMTVMLGKGSPLAKREELTLTELADRPYFSMRPDVTPNGYMNIMRFFAEKSFQPRSLRQFTSHESTILQLQLYDDAFGLMGPFQYREHPGIAFVPLAQADQPEGDSFDPVVIWRAKNENPYIPKLLALIDALE